jgi:hypothetical protein
MTDSQPPLPDRMPHGRDPRSSDSEWDYTREAALLALVAGALAASVVIYAGIAWFLTSEAMAAGFEPAGLPGSVGLALAVAGVALLIVAPVVQRKVRESARGTTPAGAVNAFRVSTVVGFALREAAAVLGLVLAILTGNPLWCYGLSAAALAAMMLGWPTRDKLERFARGAVGPS